MSTGRSPASSDRSAARAARLAERTDEKVATARTSVPPAVASAEIVTQSAMTPELTDPARVPRDQTARQIGGAFGVALLVVILGTPHHRGDALTHFQHLWWYGAGTAALSGLVCTVIGNKPRVHLESTPAPTSVPASRVAA